MISAYTAKGTIVGSDPNEPAAVFDHTSVLATVEKLFGLPPFTKRDAAANTLEVALNQADVRTDAPAVLPEPAPDGAVAGPANPDVIFAANPKAALSTNQKAMATLALACDLNMTSPQYHAALIGNHQKLIEQGDAADYIQKVEAKVASRRAAGTRD